MTTKITIKLVNRTDMDVDAHVFGEWAAHPGVRGDDFQLDPSWWVVTHVPNGICCAVACGQLDEKQAVHLAQMFAERVRPGLIPICDDNGTLPRGCENDVKRIMRSIIFDTLGYVR